MTTARAGREVYCVITDANGNSVTTDTVKLIRVASEELEIITQPTNSEAKLGETFCITVEATGEGLKYGDILLNPVTHTEIYMSDYTVGAHCSETGGKYGKAGDQTGNEINIQKYKNKNYTQVWRMAGEGKNDETLFCTYRDIAIKVIRGDYGNGQQRIIKLMNSGYNAAQINEIQQTVNLILKQGV